MSRFRRCIICGVICILVVNWLYFNFELKYILQIQQLPHKDEIAEVIRLHEERFQWHTSLHGEYCNNFSIDTESEIRRHYSKYNEEVNREDALQRIFLLSYPRSGNHLTRAVLECLLQTPTYGYKREKHYVYLQREIPEMIAKRNANRSRPFIRKYHSVNHIRSREEAFALIFVIRDPVESVTSNLKDTPYFWRHYEQEMQKTVDLASFYVHWKEEETKLLLFYEDFHDKSDRTKNLKKLQSFFGKEVISDDQMEFCVDHFENVANVALGALERTAKGHLNLHQYRDSYYGKLSTLWPVIKVPRQEFEIVFSKYENFQHC